MMFSMEQLRRLDHIKQGQFTATITEEEEAIPPRFLTFIQDVEVGQDTSFHVKTLSQKNSVKAC
jgi:hypothetical protein